MGTDIDLTTLLNRLQDQIKTGQVVLVLGPNTGCTARTVAGGQVLSHAQFIDAVRREFALASEESETALLDEVLDYCLSVEGGSERLSKLVKDHFTCRVPGPSHRVVPNFVWH